MTRAQRDAARSVVVDALETRREDRLLIISDEYTEPTARCLEATAVETVAAKVKRHLIPFIQQEKYSTTNRLPADLRRLIDDFGRVIFLQRREPTVNHFRQNVMEYCRANRARRTASMPGVVLKYLPLCKSDLPTIQRRCQLVGDLLVRASTATLTSFGPDDISCTLVIPVGEHNPILSTGRIEPGDWGNVPSGETFVVPNLAASAGSLAVTGSIVNHVIGVRQKLILQVRGGRVLPKPDASPSIHRRLRALLFDSKGQEAYENCTVVSELGIGTNSGITRLTGLPLFDEKILGTAHIGLGRSTQFKGPTSSKVHNDFVVRDPTLTLDGVTVIKDGVFVLGEADVYPNWRRLRQDEIPLQTPIHLGAQAARVDVGPGDSRVARLQWTSPRPEAIRHTTVGDDETATVAAAILDELPQCPTPTTVRDVRERLVPRHEHASIIATLRLLAQFGILRLGSEADS